MVEAVLATGTPTVLVVVSGRPYARGGYTGRAAAILQAFAPGEEGGPALAAIITGDVNPSGKRPVQVPRHPDVNPSTYLHPYLGGPTDGISNLDPSPAFPFGHGLSYTAFVYGQVRLEATEIDTAGETAITLLFTNTGTRTGTEVVQLYFTDPVAPVNRPVTQLLGFACVTLEPDRSATVRFALHADRFAFVSPDLQWTVEAGITDLAIGSSSTDIRARAALELTGTDRIVGHDRRLTTGTTVDDR